MANKNIDTRKQNIGIGCCLAFIGVVLIIINCVLLISNAVFMSDAKEVTATISDINSFTVNKKTKRTVMVTYTVNGRVYNESLGEYDKDFYVGQQLTVYYRSSDPSEISTGKNVNTLMMIPGVALILIGGGIVLYMVKKKPALNGTTIFSGTVMNIVNDTTASINGVAGSRAECKVTDNETGETRYYTSEAYDRDLSVLVGHSVAVYVDNKDKTKGYVDVMSTLDSMK